MEGKIRRQIEYYFNDFNLMRDQFLKNEIKLSKEAGKDGFIDLDVMLKFNRLAQLTTDKVKIIASLETSKQVELNDDKTGVRRPPTRKLPVDDELYRANLKARTCFADKFPRSDLFKKKKEEEKKEEGENSENQENQENGAEAEPTVEATLDEIYEYLESLDLQVETVAMRKVKKGENTDLMGKFTGSLFVTFCTLADANKFLESEGKFRDQYDIVKKTKNAYWTEQNARHEAKKKGENVEAAVTAARKQLEADKPPTYEEGIVLKFEDVKDLTLKREDVKMWVTEQDGAVEYISYESGKTEGMLLLNLTHGKKCSDILPESGKANVKGDEISFSQGDEKDFEALVQEFIAFKTRMKQNKIQGGRKGKFGNKMGGKQRGRGGDRGGRGRNSGRGGKRTVFKDSDDEGGEPKAKEAKVEE